MLTSFGKIPRLERMNLIVGKNGVGKTSLLVQINTETTSLLRPAESRTVVEIITEVAFAIRACKKVLLFDEIENGLHHTEHVEVWRTLFKSARSYNIQIFATTHSWECLSAFAKFASEDSMVIRLERDLEEAVLFDYKKLPIVIRDRIEVR